MRPSVLCVCPPFTNNPAPAFTGWFGMAFATNGFFFNICAHAFCKLNQSYHLVICLRSSHFPLVIRQYGNKVPSDLALAFVHYIIAICISDIVTGPRKQKFPGSLSCSAYSCSWLRSGRRAHSGTTTLSVSLFAPTSIPASPLGFELSPSEV